MINQGFLIKLVRYALVGLSGVGIDFGFTYFFKEKLHAHKYLANTAGFTLATFSNYILNRVWTFQSHNPHIAFEFSRFFLVSITGLAINSFALWIFTDRIKWNFYFSKLLAITLVTLWNFLVNLLFTFR